MSLYKRIIKEYTPEEKQRYWNLGNGMQAVDGLKPSEYLKEQQRQEVAGTLTLKEVKENLRRYYELRREEAVPAEKEALIIQSR